MGGFTGESIYLIAAEFVTSKVNLWSCCVYQLSDVAVSQPQAAYAVLARSLQFEWCQFICSFILPDRSGGLGISDSVESALLAFLSSCEGTYLCAGSQW